MKHMRWIVMEEKGMSDIVCPSISVEILFGAATRFEHHSHLVNFDGRSFRLSKE